MKQKSGLIITIVMVILTYIFFAGCSSVAKRGAIKVDKYLTIDRLWGIHKDVKPVYFIYKNTTIEKGLLLRWDGNRIQIQKKGEMLPQFISSEDLSVIKVVNGNRVWESMAMGGAAAAGLYFFTGAEAASSEANWNAGFKVFSIPLIIIASMFIGAGMEMTEELVVPEGFVFNYEDVKSLYELTE